MDVRADLSDEIDPDLLFDRGLRWLPGREHLPEWSFVWQWLMASGWGERDREALFERLWVWLEVPDNQRQETWDKLFESGLDAGCEGPEFLRLGAAWILMQPQPLHLRVLAVKILAAAPASPAVEDAASWMADWLRAGGRIHKPRLKRLLAQVLSEAPGTGGPGWSRLRTAWSQSPASDSPGALDEFAAGQVHVGEVTGHQDYGLFLDIKGVKGLLRKNKMTAEDEARFKTIPIGAPVPVRIETVDREQQRLSLASRDFE